MNLANKLTIARIIVVPLILLFILPIPFEGFEAWNAFVSGFGYIRAFLLFLAASITDILDGNIARKRKMVSNFGKFMDPIADKLLVLSVMAALVQLGLINSLIFTAFLFRDMVMTALRLVAAEHGKVIAAGVLGKWKTVLQSVSIHFYLLRLILASEIAEIPKTWILLTERTADLILGAALILSLISGYVYVKDNRALLLDKDK